VPLNVANKNNSGDTNTNTNTNTNIDLYSNIEFSQILSNWQKNNNHDTVKCSGYIKNLNSIKENNIYKTPVPKQNIQNILNCDKNFKNLSDEYDIYINATKHNVIQYQKNKQKQNNIPNSETKTSQPPVTNNTQHVKIDEKNDNNGKDENAQNDNNDKDENKKNDNNDKDANKKTGLDAKNDKNYKDNNKKTGLDAKNDKNAQNDNNDKNDKDENKKDKKNDNNDKNDKNDTYAQHVKIDEKDEKNDNNGKDENKNNDKNAKNDKNGKNDKNAQNKKDKKDKKNDKNDKDDKDEIMNNNKKPNIKATNDNKKSVKRNNIDIYSNINFAQILTNWEKYNKIDGIDITKCRQLIKNVDSYSEDNMYKISVPKKNVKSIMQCNKKILKYNTNVTKDKYGIYISKYKNVIANIQQTKSAKEIPKKKTPDENVPKKSAAKNHEEDAHATHKQSDNKNKNKKNLHNRDRRNNNDNRNAVHPEKLPGYMFIEPGATINSYKQEIQSEYPFDYTDINNIISWINIESFKKYKNL
jgi:hypothetical protein